MELSSQSISDLFLAKGDMSLTLEHVAPGEAVLDHTVQDITAQIIGLGEGKLNLYVPSEAIIEPISPAEVMPEENTLVVSTYESTENGMPSGNVHPQSNNFSDAGMPDELIAVDKLVSNSNPSDAKEDTDVRADMTSTCDTTSKSTAIKNTEISKKPASARKFIPPKKDRMEPLKMDMSKPKVIPLTSSQLSLQCLECHIIFSDDRSKQRHLKMNHPSEYEQCMLGDALFACYVCDRHFNCSTELMAHQRSHTEKQPFKCPICDEAFSRSSELTSHKKEEAEGVENLTNATSKTRKRRSKGPSSKKYVCSQCNEFFKTAKSMLHHNKTKHSQCPTITQTNSTVAGGSPCVATLTEVVQLPLSHVDSNGQAVQQIGPLEAEQIKRLIEKMGNVQKVNQLVILGLDQLPLQTQSSVMQQPQGLIKPLHFDFTQPTVQQTVCQPAGNERGHEETSIATEQDTLLKSLQVEVAVKQNETVVQDNTIISASCQEKRVIDVESNMTGEQVNDIQYNVLLELPGKNILLPQLEVTNQLVLTTEQQQIQGAPDVKTGNDLSLNLITEIESRVISEKEFLTATDITAFRNAVINTKPNQTGPTSADSSMKPETKTNHGNVLSPDVTNTTADPLSQMADALDSLVELEIQTVQDNLGNIEQTSNNTKTQNEKAMADSLLEPQAETEQRKPNLDNGQEAEYYLEHQQLKEILSPENNILQISEPSLVNIQDAQEMCPLNEATSSETSIQKSQVESEDRTLLNEEFPFMKKTLPVKKKRSKKQVSKSSKYLENHDEVARSILLITSNQKIKTVSKTPKKQEKKKKCFVNKQSKKKCSKAKLFNISKNSLYDDLGNDTEVLSHNEIKKLKQKRIKGRKAEKSARVVHVPALPCEQKVINVSEQANQGKPPKRKFENQRHLVKKGKTTAETQQDESPIPKKKKTDKVSEPTPQKSVKNNTPVNKANKKSHKLAKHREKDNIFSETPVIDQIQQQALLFLKGHKQPQLKVHKLDAKTTGLDHQLMHKCQTKESHDHKTTAEPAKEGIPNKQLQAPSQKKKKVKTLKKKSKVDSKQSSHLQTSPINNGFPSGAKQKAVRKRKAPAKIDQEIALSPPYSRLIIGCHDCGKSFSEVSALQEHMALMHSENGAHRSNVPCDGSEISMVSQRPSEIMLPNAAHSSDFGIHVPTDWDVDSEMREIGLGNDRTNEHRLSFPALSPSPSFSLTTTFVGEECKQDNTLSQEPSFGHRKTVCSNSACHVETNESRAEQDVDSPPPVSFPQKNISNEEALSDVNLVMVEDQNEGGSHISGRLYTVSPNSFQKDSNLQVEESSHTILNQNSSITQNQLTTKPVNLASTYNAGSHVAEQSKIKQEADEIAVETVESQTNSSITKGKRGRGSKGKGKRQLGRRKLGKKHTAENRITEEVADEDCQVVFELYSLTGNSEEGNAETPTNKEAIHFSAASTQPTLKESLEVQEACVLPQLAGTNDLEVMRSGYGSLTKTSEEQDKNSSVSSSLMKERISVPNWSGIGEQGNQQSDNGLFSTGTSTNVKTEASPSALTPHVAQGDDFLQEVQMILVKAEDQQISNDPHIIHEAQHMQCLGSPTVAQSTAKHCIFYPVKEEEREILVEPQVNNQGTSDSELTEQREGPWGVPGLEEAEVRTGCPQMEMHHNVYSSTEEGSVGAEQQNTEDILEFLSQTSDTEDFDGVHSEPEAETHIMSCYHGISASGSVRQCEMASKEQHAKTSKNTGGPEVDDQPSGSQERCEPIHYFIQYFSWSIWKDIAAYTQQGSKLPKPVTEKEVAQFVGIHIAMGTLKFPSMKLYWDDFTRVPLIADAMSAAMFSELASNLKLASLDNQPIWKEQDAQKDQDEHNCAEILVSKKDPLWKIQAIVNRVREGCQALKRNGNYGVDQYLLPFQRHPTHSLHHTVMVNAAGLVMDFSLRVTDCNREEIVEKMVSQEKSDGQGVVFLCKPELSTPSMLEHLLESGVRSAGKVGGARGQIGDEFVTSDGKLKLFRCHHGFILSAVTKEKSRSTSLVSGFERAIKAANLNRDLRSLYRTPCTSSSPSAWPQSVLWDLIDLALVNSWLQYQQEQTHLSESLSLMAFRLEVSKALISSSNIAVQDSSPPYLPPPVRPGSNASTGHSDVLETPLPDAATRYDGLGHWPEQLSEGEEARCRFGGCDQMSRVRFGDPHTGPVLMDSDLLKIEEIVMGGGEADPPADGNTEKAGKPYAELIIPDPSPTPVIQSYQHESLQCFQCFITFCNSKAKERHMKKSHREEYKQQLQQCDTLFTCYVCDRTFPSSEELTQHQSTHNKEDKPFKCSHCSESFRTFSELTTHRRQVCPERQFVCKECNETFRSPALLRTHRLVQHPARPDIDDTDNPSKTFRCGKCGRGFEEESELLQHQENHAANQHCNGSGPVKKRGRPPKAEPTSATIEKKPKLNENETTEKSEEPATAPQADEAKSKPGVRRGRPPKPALQDPKAEENKADRKKSKAVSPTARQIPCTECELVFSAPAQLRAHKKEKHMQRKAHPCQECEESFNRAEQLEAHMARAHKAGRYSCSTCGKSFGRESNLKAHQQSHEKEDEKSAEAGKR
ncbi:Zinc finger protein 90 [Bagarius yarrelli]|uniref:Zinc finger protein 90 n=1 Tax=Bagarius yarrelli TaxID=175774 RepID=A0A556U198_BAGYA|nr:Zinc finger protein 90 [Bagarius yarrelli]